jgi:hypothetical protein
MLGEFKEYHNIHGNPVLDACNTFEYCYAYIYRVSNFYGYANKGRTVSFWMTNSGANGELRVSFSSQSGTCIGNVFASLSKEEQESLLAEIDTLGKEFEFFRQE